MWNLGQEVRGIRARAGVLPLVSCAARGECANLAEPQLSHL